MADIELNTDKWINVEDKLPKPNTMVIVACYGTDLILPHYGETLEEAIKRTQKEFVNVTIGFIGNDGWCGADHCPMMVTPSYWQPLPEPPKIGG